MAMTKPVPAVASSDGALRTRLRRYYTTYYRDTLGLRDWSMLVDRRDDEERQERARVDQLRRLLGEPALHGRILNVGCGTGGFNVAAGSAGARVVGVDCDQEAIAICGLRGGASDRRAVHAVAEALPFRAVAFDVVYCFSAIEHVDSVEASIGEMARVAQPGGAIYVHTPNAWSWYEGHYKLFWVPFLPRWLGMLYLRLRGRPTAYLATVRRLTPSRLRRAFHAVGIDDVRAYRNDAPRERGGLLWFAVRLYYRLTGVAPYIELVARKPLA